MVWRDSEDGWGEDAACPPARCKRKKALAGLPGHAFAAHTLVVYALSLVYVLLAYPLGEKALKTFGKTKGRGWCDTNERREWGRVL